MADDSNATRAPYKRPPITEAVIEFRFQSLTDRSLIEKAARRFKRKYPVAELGLEFQVMLEPQPQQLTHRIQNQWSGLKLSSADRADVVLLRPFSLTTSRLAPYTGWEDLRDRAVETWSLWKKTAGFTPLARIGVRYLNRIDVRDEGGPISVDDFILVTPRLPERDWPPMTNFAIQVTRPLGLDDCFVILNAGSVPSPLLDTFSFLLDIDIYRETDLPMKDKELWELVERVRAHKNEMFELCITDRARELFNA
jgi:uncharacterized protein (TIGR04255 family)